MTEREITFPGGGKLLVWKSEERAEDLLATLHLPDNLNGFHEIKTSRRRMEYLGVRVSLRHLFGEEVCLWHDNEGCPHVLNRAEHVSVSHSGAYVAVLSDVSSRVGVDIECFGGRVARVAGRFLHRDEWRFVRGETALATQQVLWSSKEALYKILGKRVFDFKESLRSLPFRPAEEGSLRVEDCGSGLLYHVDYVRNERYTLAYCFDRPL